MRDDDYISSRRDIRNRRYKRRRRQIMLNRCIFGGIVLIIVLIGIIIGVKSCRNENTPGVIQNNSSGDKTKNDTVPSTDENSVKPTEETATEPKDEPDAYKKDGKRIVVVDPGHGGMDGGSVGPDGSLEKNDNLNMALAVKAALESRGITVYMTRDGDTFPSVEERAEFANSKHADLLLSIHRNEYASDTSVKGFEAWIQSTKPDDTSDLASRIQKELISAGITRDRGVKAGTQSSGSKDYVVNSQTKGPSILLEMGFMTNAEDNNLFRNNTNTLAEAIAKAVAAWMDAQGL